MTGKFAKFAFKTFNKNASALNLPSDVQSLMREVLETLTLHGSILQDLAETEAPEAEDSFVLEAVGGGLEFDEVDLVLHQEVFGS